MKPVRTIAILLAATTTCLAAPAVAQEGVSFRLTATVQPFCRVTPQIDSGTPLYLENGQAELGLISELCNTRNGYVMNMQLVNIEGGLLRNGEVDVPVDAQGQARFTSDRPRVRRSFWRLSEAKQIDSERPIFLRVSISPI